MITSGWTELAHILWIGLFLKKEFIGVAEHQFLYLYFAGFDK
jgi:hypothetical protein